MKIDERETLKTNKQQTNTERNKELKQTIVKG